VRLCRLFLAEDSRRYRITGAWHSTDSEPVGALVADTAHGGWGAGSAKSENTLVGRAARPD
jgi:hypothetical protein